MVWTTRRIRAIVILRGWTISIIEVWWWSLPAVVGGVIGWWVRPVIMWWCWFVIMHMIWTSTPKCGMMLRRTILTPIGPRGSEWFGLMHSEAWVGAMWHGWLWRWDVALWDDLGWWWWAEL